MASADDREAEFKRNLEEAARHARDLGLEVAELRYREAMEWVSLQADPATSEIANKVILLGAANRAVDAARVQLNGFRAFRNQYGV